VGRAFPRERLPGARGRGARGGAPAWCAGRPAHGCRPNPGRPRPACSAGTASPSAAGASRPPPVQLEDVADGLDRVVGEVGDRHAHPHVVGSGALLDRDLGCPLVRPRLVQAQRGPHRALRRRGPARPMPVDEGIEPGDDHHAGPDVDVGPLPWLLGVGRRPGRGPVGAGRQDEAGRGEARKTPQGTSARGRRCAVAHVGDHRPPPSAEDVRRTRAHTSSPAGGARKTSRASTPPGRDAEGAGERPQHQRGGGDREHGEHRVAGAPRHPLAHGVDGPLVDVVQPCAQPCSHQVPSLCHEHSMTNVPRRNNGGSGPRGRMQR
jgi:hypothetical protein